MSLSIRKATQNDMDVLVRFNAAMARETEQKHLDKPTLRRGVLAVLNDDRKGFYLVAESEGEVIGQLLITFEWSDWRNGWFWWLQSVFVRENSRRQGVFRQLYGHLQNLARANPDVIGLRLYVEAANSRAKQTYEALGMSDESYHVMGVLLPGQG